MATMDGNNTQDEDETDEPQEVVGPEGCEPVVDDTELAPGERDDTPDNCSFSPMDEVEEAFPVVPIPLVIDPTDGLIRPVDQSECYSPAFCEDNVVCIADERMFVEVFHEELLDLGWSFHSRSLEYITPERGTRLSTDDASSGFIVNVRKRFDSSGAERTRLQFKPSATMVLWGEKFGTPSVDGEIVAIIPVKPIREKCCYYMRQVFANQAQPDPTAIGSRTLYVHCTRRRSVGGAFMSLSDEAIYACDHRDPPDKTSVDRDLDAFDQKRLRERPDRTLVAMFGLGGTDVTKEGDSK